MARFRKKTKIWRIFATGCSEILNIGRTDYFSLNTDLLFGREAPLEIEIGAGRGDFIFARAAAMPERNFLAVELSLTIARLLAGRAMHAQVKNLRVVRTDARPLVNLFLPSASVSAYHIYFPDPWPKGRHAKRRLFTPWFVANLRRTMTAGALLFVATDVHDYATSIFSMITSEGLRPTSEPAAAVSVTGFARKYMREGRTVYSRTFAK